MKQAVILAAGRGSRLSTVSNGTPKCLIKVGGVTLIERQLQRLRQVGISRVCVVVGHRAELVREVVGSQCDFIVNERFAETNSLYSLWMARRWVSGPFVLMNCDVLAHPDIYHRVMAVNGNALAFDSSSGGEDEHMKVSLRSHLVRSLSKQMPAEQVDGENVGILQFDRQGAELLLADAEAMIESGSEQHWAPAAVDRIARRIPIRGVDIAGLPWTEIDFPDDLASAEEDICPVIETGCWIADRRSARRLSVA